MLTSVWLTSSSAIIHGAGWGAEWGHADKAGWVLTRRPHSWVGCMPPTVLAMV